MWKKWNQMIFMYINYYNTNKFDYVFTRDINVFKLAGNLNCKLPAYKIGSEKI